MVFLGMFVQLIMKSVLFIFNISEYHTEIDSQDNTETVLNSIRDDIRETLPLEAVTETEHVMQPKYGKVSCKV